MQHSISPSMGLGLLRWLIKQHTNENKITLNSIYESGIYDVLITRPQPELAPFNTLRGKV